MSGEINRGPLNWACHIHANIEYGDNRDVNIPKENIYYCWEMYIRHLILGIGHLLKTTYIGLYNDIFLRFMLCFISV